MSDVFRRIKNIIISNSMDLYDFWTEDYWVYLEDMNIYDEEE